MKIKWLGHACFKLMSNDSSVVVDPFKDGSVPGYANIREIASAAYKSHDHGDHNAVELIEIDGTQPFPVEIIDTYHDDKQGALRGPNKIHIFTIEGMKVVHLGDLGCDLTSEQVEVLKGADVVMIPVGGHYTIDAMQAKKVVDQINPRVIIPMHYSASGFGYDVIGPVTNFTSLFTNVTIVDNDLVEITPEAKEQVCVLTYNSK